MLTPDVNLLIYAVDRDSPFHAQARRWLDETIFGTENVGLAWNVLLGFLRLTTRVVQKPLSVEAALQDVALWLRRPNVTVIHPGPRHFELLSGLLASVGTAGNLTSDAHLAAIAIEHGAEVCSADADFARFPGLKCCNPLIQ